MRLKLVPTRGAVYVLAGVAVAAVVALALRVPLASVGWSALAAVGLCIVYASIDLLHSTAAWRRSPLQWQRRLPAALALGVARVVPCALINESGHDWRVALFDHVDPDLDVEGLPMTLLVPGKARTELHYSIVPRRRGLVTFAPA
ncbi:MAG TPA: DUF58 domain-containing protein, partial [Albitalea sp.]|nr:DUF58 domain-containing protein [Albitalea sp.]